MHMTASLSHSESRLGNCLGARILPAGQQTENKICEGDPAGKGAPRAAWGTMASGDVLQQLVDVPGHCCKEFKAPTSTATRRQTTKTNLVCWKCKQTGYRRAQCPLLQGNRPTQQQSENRVSQLGNGK